MSVSVCVCKLGHLVSTCASPNSSCCVLEVAESFTHTCVLAIRHDWDASEYINFTCVCVCVCDTHWG